MAKKEKTQDELIEMSRNSQDDYNSWKGSTDAKYFLSFAKPLLDSGFTHEQVMSAYINNQTIELSIELKDREIEIAKINAKYPEEDCECDVCKASREDSIL